MAGIQRFEEIRAWQKARELVKAVYKLSNDGQLAKDFELKNQIRGAAVSVMSNIAEGFARKGQKEFARFLDIARGSAIEVQSLLYVALDVEYISSTKFEQLYSLADETVCLIAKFTSYLRNSAPHI